MISFQETGEPAHVLDLDPDFGVDLDPDDWGAARAACLAELVNLPTGHCELAAHVLETNGSVGFAIVSGLVCRGLTLRDRHLIELLGGGDILRPTSHEDWPLLGVGPQITVLSDTVVLALGTPFIRAAARWPSLLTTVLDRLDQQRERLMVQELIVHLPQAEHRLLLMLWHLAERWGHVTPDGLRLPLRLTHETIGQLIAARRSTVTLAAGELEETGCIRRLSDGTWIVTELGRHLIERVTRTDPSHTLGDMLLLRQRSGELLRDARTLHGAGRSSPGHRRA